jgi:hypothetical protein
MTERDHDALMAKESFVQLSSAGSSQRSLEMKALLPFAKPAN